MSDFTRVASGEEGLARISTAWHTVEAVYDMLSGREVQAEVSGAKRPQMHPHDLVIPKEILMDDEALQMALDTLHRALGVFDIMRDRKRARATVVLAQRVSKELMDYAQDLCMEGSELSFSEHFDEAAFCFEAAIAVQKFVLANFRKRHSHSKEVGMTKDEQTELANNVAAAKHVLEHKALLKKRTDLRLGRVSIPVSIPIHQLLLLSTASPYVGFCCFRLWHDLLVRRHPNHRRVRERGAL